VGFFSFLNRAHTPQAPRHPRSYLQYSGGTFITDDSAMEVSAYYSGLIYVSTQIAKLPIEIKNRENKIINPKGVAEIVDLMPNQEMSAFLFWSLMVQTAINKGNAYCEIEKTLDGRIKNLWFIPSEHVSVLRQAENGKLYYRVSDGHYTGRGDAILMPEDVFHLRNFHTKDGILGQGVIAYAAESLGISSGADKFANSIFANGGLPSGVIEVEGSLTEEAALRLKDGWQRNHGGRKTGGTAILEGGAKFNAISHDPQVLQFLETRKFSVIEIARFLRVPPSKLYDQDTSTYNNIEHDNLRVAVDTLDAWAKNIEQEIDIKLLNKRFGGAHSEFKMSAIFRGDMKTRSDYQQNQLESGAMSPNEIRIEEGRQPYDGGDEYYIASNNLTPISRLNELLDSQIEKEKRR
jgi:HK97 family phage portal protein